MSFTIQFYNRALPGQDKDLTFETEEGVLHFVKDLWPDFRAMLKNSEDPKDGGKSFVVLWPTPEASENYDVPAALVHGSNDEWIDYQVWLGGDVV